MADPVRAGITRRQFSMAVGATLCGAAVATIGVVLNGELSTVPLALLLAAFAGLSAFWSP